MKLSNADFVDITEKGLKCFENSLKSNECNNHFQNFGSMAEKSDRLINLYPKIEETSKNTIVVKLNPKLDALKPHYDIPITKIPEVKKLKPMGDTAITNIYSFSPKNNDIELKNKRYTLYNYDRPRSYDGLNEDVGEPTQLSFDKPLFSQTHLNGSAEDKLHDVRSYDTYTVFDKKKVDIARLKQCYALEVELLKEKLRELKNSNDSTLNDKSVHLIKPQVAVNPKDSVTNSESNKSFKTKVSVKTKAKTIAIKSKKKPKSCSSSSDMTVSTISDSETSEAETVLYDSVDGIEQSTGTSNSCQSDKNEVINWPIRESLFPHIPPYITFSSFDRKNTSNLPSGARYLKWKLSTITPVLIRKTLINSGFRMVRKSNDWMGTWGKHMKSPMFKTLKETQKLNHFPGTFQIGRKDRLWRNFQKCMNLYGYKEFGFIPQTYVLPQDLKLLRQHWQHKNGDGDEKYIIKPPASARGSGIKVINRWSQLPKRMSLVVQQYISNPYLINRSKFDLRLYVLVTSFDPLRIYLYPEGLVRFASVPYSDNVKDLKDRYMHLTNYSINKLSSMYTANEDANSCKGHKWTLSKLWEYMDKKGVNTKALWKNLQELVIKTIITGESTIVPLCRENMISRYSCYELFGVDVLLDENLKTWLLEVNISPSLHSQSSLDEHVKGPMIQSMFSLVQFHLPQKLGRTSLTVPKCYDPRLYSVALTKKEIQKHNSFTQVMSREEYLNSILENLTGDDIRFLTKAEDELTVIGNFERIFPTSKTYEYLNFLEIRYYNRLFDAWEHTYELSRHKGIQVLQTLCEQKLHLKVAPPTVLDKNLPNSNLLEENQVTVTDYETILPTPITDTVLPEMSDSTE